MGPHTLLQIGEGCVRKGIQRKIFATSNMRIIRNMISIPDWSVPGSTTTASGAAGQHLSWKLLLLAKDKGRGEEEGMLGGSEREGYRCYT